MEDLLANSIFPYQDKIGYLQGMNRAALYFIGIWKSDLDALKAMLFLIEEYYLVWLHLLRSFVKILSWELQMTKRR